MLSPLTRASNTVHISSHCPQYIAERWATELGIEVGADFRNLSSIDYWRCNATGLHWYTPAEAAGRSGLYSQLETRDWYYMANKWEFYAALDAINGKQGSCEILEVGVGFGHFLTLATEKGHKASGVEMNKTAVQRVRAQGYQVYEGDLISLSRQTDARFDVVCAFQVLEHVPDPGDFLQGMIAVLRPGGKVILSIPNAAVMRRIDPRREGLLNQPPHHMSHWDEGVFKAMENLFPLEVAQVRREPLAPYHVRWFVEAYLRHSLSRVAPLDRYLANRFTMLPIQWLLRTGIRRLVPGHTLFVVLEYQP